MVYLLAVSFICFQTYLHQVHLLLSILYTDELLV